VPELPEVEFCRQALTRWTMGRNVVGVEVIDPRVVRNARTDAPSAGRPDGAEVLMRTCVTGAAVEPPRRASAPSDAGTGARALVRHGKRLLWAFGDTPDAPALLLHLGMTGKWTREPPDTPAPRHAKVRLVLDDGTRLSYIDPRLLGGIVPTTVAAGTVALREGLGPDALGAPLPPLRGRRPVKVALMDQALIAGLGNVQVMESLWRAGIHPETPCEALTPAQHARLDSAVQETLRRTLADLGDGDEVTYVEESLAANPFAIYRRAGTPCPACGAPIARMVQAGRGTYWCPRCQPAAVTATPPP
jgi:formamidopyrimidine-DNA glycosylase